MSLTDRILPRNILSRVRVPVRPRIFYPRKNPNTESPTCCLFCMQMSLHDWTKISPRSQFYSDHRVNLSTYRYCQSATFGPLAFCVCSLFFYDIKSKRISNRHSCDVYIQSECGSCRADVATAARSRTAMHDYGRFYSFINKISFQGSRRFIFTGSCSATPGLLLS